MNDGEGEKGGKKEFLGGMTKGGPAALVLGEGDLLSARTGEEWANARRALGGQEEREKRGAAPKEAVQRVVYFFFGKRLG